MQGVYKKKVCVLLACFALSKCKQLRWTADESLPSAFELLSFSFSQAISISLGKFICV